MIVQINVPQSRRDHSIGHDSALVSKMWGALKNAASAVTSDLQVLTKDTLNQAQQLLEKLDGNDEEDEEDPDARIDGDEGDEELPIATDQAATEVSKEVVQVSVCYCWYYSFLSILLILTCISKSRATGITLAWSHQAEEGTRSCQEGEQGPDGRVRAV